MVNMMVIKSLKYYDSDKITQLININKNMMVIYSLLLCFPHTSLGSYKTQATTTNLTEI